MRTLPITKLFVIAVLAMLPISFRYLVNLNYIAEIFELSFTLMVEPNDIQAHHNRAVLLREVSLDDLAMRDFQKIVELDPNDAIAYEKMGDFYRQKNNKQQSLYNYHEAWRSRRCDEDAFSNGYACEDLKRNISISNSLTEIRK
jgi:Tfp pilus assembly protein PilF